MSRVWFIENVWRCSSCKASNKGRDLNCSKCGARKSADLEYDTMSSGEEITDPELLKKAKAGANWICEFCGGEERNLRGDCTQCGGLKSLPKAKVSKTSDPLINDIKPWWSNPANIGQAIKRNPTRTAVIASVVAGSGLLAMFLVWLFTPKHVDAKVDGIQWSYTSNLRERQIKHDSEWGHPGNKGFYKEPAFNVSCKSEYYGTEDCHPHDCNPHRVSYSCNCTSYDCNCRTTCVDQKNGFSRCSESCSRCNKCDTCYRTEYDTCYDQCPVYKDRCEYDYYEWPISRTESTSGEDHKVYWPPLRALPPDQRLQNIEKYQVNFSCQGESYEYTPANLTDFNRFDVGQFWRLQVGRIRTHNIEDLQRIQAEKD